MNTQAILTAVIQAKDEASATLAKVAKNINGVSFSAENLKPVFKGMRNAGTVAFAAISGEIYAAVTAANEAQKVEAQLNAVIKSTGGIAGVTAKSVLDLSSALQNTTTYNDEMITSAQNLLLTFTNISKDVFPEATKTILDMSTALGQDTTASAIQLGKALNDPIRGVSALRKVGVSFTESQQEQIKVLVESGKTMEAQKLILKELGMEFGGSAAAQADTFAGKVTQLKNRLDDLQEGIGKSLIPIIEKIVEKIAPIIEKIIVWIEQNPKLTATILIIAASIAGLVAVMGLLGLAALAVGAFFASAAAPIIAIALLIGAMLIPVVMVFYQLWPEIVATVKQAFENIGETILLFWQAFKLNFETALTWLQVYWNRLKQGFIDVWEGIKATAKAMVDAIMSYINPIIKTVENLANKMASVAKSIGGSVKSVFTGATSAVKGLFGINDGIVQGGKIITTHPEDTIVAMKDMSKFGGGGRNINIHISGAIITDEAARIMGNKIIDQLRFQMKF